jgi:hypothetical protein
MVPTERRRAMRIVNVAGLSLIALIVISQTGVFSREWWVQFTAPKPAPIVKAPVHVPTKAIGITPPLPKGNDSSASPVPLPLLLVSVKPGKTFKDGSAQIGVVRESPQTYQAGALLENGARLAEIHADYVLLEKNSQTARLYLSNARETVPPNNAMLTVGGKQLAPPAPITSREELTDYIRPSPVFDGEQIVGYQVYAGAKTGPFYQMGLMQGDVITAIDGSPLEDSSSAWEMLRGLTDGAVLSATIKRNGKILDVTLDGGVVASAEAARTQAPAQAMLTTGSQSN